MEGRIESSNPQGTSLSLRKIAFSNENKHILTTYPLLALQHCHPQIPAKLSHLHPLIFHGRIITETCLAISFEIHKPIFVGQIWENEPPAN